jgi:hypothetical protein
MTSRLIVIVAVVATALSLGGGTGRAVTPSAGSCQSGPVFLSTQDHTFCGPQIFGGTATAWVRDRETGKITAVPGARWHSDPPYGP